MKIHVTHDVPEARAHDLLVSALEGGSNYWAVVEDRENPAEGAHSYYTDPLWDDKRAAFPGKLHAMEVPFQKGGALILSDTEEGGNSPYTLDYLQIQQGLHVMAQNYPEHWGDFMSENDDADTADVFLQCALFGKVIYG